MAEGLMYSEGLVLTSHNGQVVNTAIAGVAPTASPTFTGTVTLPTTALTNTLTITDGKNIVLDTTTGTKIGTATTQKLGFFNATPSAQIAGSTDVLAGMVTLGFRAASSNPPLNLGTGAITGGATSVAALTATSVVGTGTVALTGHMTITDAKNIVLDTTTGTKIGTDPLQKLAFYNHAPVAQQTGVAVDAAGIHAALVNLGLITA